MGLLNSHLGRLRIIAFLEGVSYLLLLGVAMPLKYFGGYVNATQDVGMAHGILFVMYILAIIPVKIGLKWPLQTTAWVVLASLLPFGTFVADNKIFRKYSVQAEKIKK